MKIVVEVKDEELTAILEGICREQFRGGNRFENGAGYSVLKKRAIAVIEQTDYNAAIRECVQRLAPGVVEEVCAGVLRTKIKQCVVDMKKKGELPMFETKDGDASRPS